MNHLYCLSATHSFSKWSTKCFLLGARYFNLKEDIKHGLADFYSNPNETFWTFVDNILQKMENNGCMYKKVAGYTGHSNSFNYGIYNSVFQHFKIVNFNIILPGLYHLQELKS